MEHVGYGLFPAMPDEAKQIYEPIKAEFQERFRLKIAEGKENKGKYKEKYNQVQNEKTDIMTKLHDRGLVDDDLLMQLFGYENKKTFQNAMSRSRQRENGEY
jgi:t-SNARE complex subunit (syntaxin)